MQLILFEAGESKNCWWNNLDSFWRLNLKDIENKAIEKYSQRAEDWEGHVGGGGGVNCY